MHFVQTLYNRANEGWAGGIIKPTPATKKRIAPMRGWLLSKWKIRYQVGIIWSHTSHHCQESLSMWRPAPLEVCQPLWPRWTHEWPRFGATPSPQRSQLPGVVVYTRRTLYTWADWRIFWGYPFVLTSPSLRSLLIGCMACFSSSAPPNWPPALSWFSSAGEWVRGVREGGGERESENFQWF
jgi:hypothetical protein